MIAVRRQRFPRSFYTGSSQNYRFQIRVVPEGAISILLKPQWLHCGRRIAAFGIQTVYEKGGFKLFSAC